MPAVERLDHHQDAKLLTDLYQLWGGRVVRGAQRVGPHAPHQLHLVHQRVVAHGRADRALGDVPVDALQLQGLAVEREARAGVRRGWELVALITVHGPHLALCRTHSPIDHQKNERNQTHPFASG